MKTVPIAGVIALLATGCAVAPAAPAPPPAQDETVRRLASILDYVAADYGGAVVDGRVVNDAEYAEQLAFLKDAGELGARLPPAGIEIAGELAGIAALVERKAAAEEVAGAARGLRRRVLEAYGVVLAPPGPPSRERGAELYAANCVACHGARGAGDGPEAQRHDPPPRSFHDPAVMVDLSPARAFSALTDGIDGTAMPSFGTLAPADRWSLAFYVFTLRHDEAAVRRGADAYQRAGRRVSAAPTRLAGMTDGDLLRELGPDALAWLRVDAPFRQTGAPLDGARRRLGAAMAAYRGGDRSAYQAVGAAYLDGFEPHEAALRARDAALVGRIEERFLSVRRQMEGGAAADEVERAALQLGVLLDRADETLAGGGGARVAFAGALLVILREGLEAALLVLLLLGLARRAGAGDDARAVHGGWLAACGVGVVTWFASGPLLRLGGARREIVEGAVALLAAAVLLFAGHFVLARLDARRRVEALKRRFAGVSRGRRRWALFGLAFLAVYREAFEVVLFLRAIALDAAGSAAAVAGGAAAGAAVLVALVVLLGRVGRRLQPGPLLTASGTLLCGLAVILAGKGVRALQEAGVLAISPVRLPRVEWLGLFPSLQGLLAQALVLGAFAAIAAVAVRRARRPSQAV